MRVLEHAAAIAIVCAAVVGQAGLAAAAVSPLQKCQATKIKAGGKLSACRATERSKRLLGRAFDIAKCEAAFAKSLAKADDAAARRGITCRFLDNGDRTISDLDTGLMWEKKDTEGGLHDQARTYSWTDAMGDWLSQVNGNTFYGPGGSLTHSPGLGGFKDWRVPTMHELATIIDPDVAGCGFGSSCIDPIFGPTAQEHWSSSSSGSYPGSSHFADFHVPFSAGLADRASSMGVRAVRGGP